MKYLVLLLCAFMLVPASAGFADKRAALSSADGQECAMKEDGNVNINFSNTETDASKIKPMIDAKIKEIVDLAKQSGVAEAEVQSMNYSANGNSSGGACGGAGVNNVYQVYGNITLKVTPADKAAELMTALAAKGYNAGFNVNAYRQCQ